MSHMDAYIVIIKPTTTIQTASNNYLISSGHMPKTTTMSIQKLPWAIASSRKAFTGQIYA